MKDSNGNFAFKEMVKDEEYESAKGYNSGGEGDSGGPVWMKTYRGGKKEMYSEEQRHTVIAVQSNSFGFHKIYAQGRQDKCINQGTKLTEDIIEWIKEMDKNTPKDAIKITS